MRIFILAIATLTLLALRAGGEEMQVANAAPLEPQVQNGVKFLSGGVGDREQDELLVLDKKYNLRVALTDAKGEYLSGIHVTIENSKGEALVETTTDGPILLAELAPGRYVLKARDEGRKAERRVLDVPKAPEQARVYVAMPHEGGS
jgi:hypothetical protein